MSMTGIYEKSFSLVGNAVNDSTLILEKTKEIRDILEDLIEEEEMTDEMQGETSASVEEEEEYSTSSSSEDYSEATEIFPRIQGGLPVGQRKSVKTVMFKFCYDNHITYATFERSILLFDLYISRFKADLGKLVVAGIACILEVSHKRDRNSCENAALDGFTIEGKVYKVTVQSLVQAIHEIKKSGIIKIIGTGYESIFGESGTLVIRNDIYKNKKQSNLNLLLCVALIVLPTSQGDTVEKNTQAILKACEKIEERGVKKRDRLSVAILSRAKELTETHSEMKIHINILHNEAMPN